MVTRICSDPAGASTLMAAMAPNIRQKSIHQRPSPPAELFPAVWGGGGAGLLSGLDHPDIGPGTANHLLLRTAGSVEPTSDIDREVGESAEARVGADP